MSTAAYPRGGDSYVTDDGDDGDGQGSRFWAVCHGPEGEALLSAPQAKKILGPKRRLTAKLSDFEVGTHDRHVQYRGVLTPVLDTIDAIPNPTCTGLLVGVIKY